MLYQITKALKRDRTIYNCCRGWILKCIHSQPARRASNKKCALHGDKGTFRKLSLSYQKTGCDKNGLYFGWYIISPWQTRFGKYDKANRIDKGSYNSGHRNDRKLCILKVFPNKASHVELVCLAHTDERSTVTSSRIMYNEKMFPTSQGVCFIVVTRCAIQYVLATGKHRPTRKKLGIYLWSMTSQLYFIPQATHPVSI